MVKFSYIGLYALLGFMTVSGFEIHFYKELGISKDLTHSIKKLHELAYNLVMIFVVMHLAGVFIAENRDEKGIVSDMIHGGKS
jgi:cytochrome b